MVSLCFNQTYEKFLSVKTTAAVKAVAPARSKCDESPNRPVFSNLAANQSPKAVQTDTVGAKINTLHYLRKFYPS